MSIFQSLNTDELAVAAALIAVAFSKVLNNTDLNSLANFITAVGSIMESIAAQQQAQSQSLLVEQLPESKPLQSEPDVQAQIKELQEQIQWLINNKNQ